MKKNLISFLSLFIFACLLLSCKANSSDSFIGTWENVFFDKSRGGAWHTNFKIEKQDKESFKVSGEKYWQWDNPQQTKVNHKNVNYIIYKKSETTYQNSPGRFEETATFSINSQTGVLELNGIACQKVSDN